MATSFLHDIRSVVHVGANEGQERDLYAEHGLWVLWVEAIPAVHEILRANLAGHPRQRAVQALATDRAGRRHSFHVSNNGGASSSLYDFALHRDIWPEVTFTHDVELVSTTLDEVVAGERGGPPPEALVMDVQGAELLVLRGAERLVRRLRYIKAEAADFDSYEGGTTAAELRAHLEGRGFDLVEQEAFAEHPDGGRYYELLFRRRPRRWPAWLRP